MINSYINTALAVHGSEVAEGEYIEEPDIYIDIKTSITTRDNNTEKINIIIDSAILSGLNGLSYFGYSLNVYASLDDGERKLLISKPEYPDQWNTGDYRLSGNIELSSVNTSTITTLKIWTESSCTCNNGDVRIVKSIQLSVPRYTSANVWRYNNSKKQDGSEIGWQKVLFIKKYNGTNWENLS